MKNARIIIDTDPGIDDAMAIIFAILSGMNISGITTVYGNATVQNTTQNIFMLLELCKRRDISVFQGAARPLLKLPRLAECHGKTGLGAFSMDLPEDAHSSGTAKNFLCNELKRDKRTLLCLGPLTNVAETLQLDPSLASNIDSMIFLGGGFSGPGNMSPYGEFNVYNDPDALDQILRYPIKKIMIPLEICRKVTINKEEFDSVLIENPLRTIVHSIVDVFIDYYQNDTTYGGFAGGVMYDLLVVGFYLFPELFTLTYTCVTVDVSDTEMRGRTSMCAGPENAFVVTNVDAMTLKNNFLARMRAWNLRVT
jgi:inosine-uridine nucleoside N-ribohydrolase